MADSRGAALLEKFLADRSDANREALMGCWTEYATVIARGFLRRRGIFGLDAVREVALNNLWRAVECFRPEYGATFRSYIYTRVSLGAKGYRPPGMPECEREELSPGMAAADDRGRRNMRESISAVLVKIKPKYALVLRLRYLEGLTQEQIGDRIGMSRRMVRDLCSEGLKAAQRVTSGGGKK